MAGTGVVRGIAPAPADDPLEVVFAYHTATKHGFHAYARGPGQLDWANQPDPFRRYTGAPLFPLDRVPPTDQPLYEPAFLRGQVPAAPLNRAGISQLFFDSLSLSAWKEAGESRWALRVNPSSGNLHPTEGYLICGPVDGLSDGAGIYHYAPKEHALELRARLSAEQWAALSASFPPGTLFVGFTSIHWREAWKYGQRAYRYCQHDVGHALGALAIAAAGLGWEARLLDDLGMEELAQLFGVPAPGEVEAEHPDCLIAIFPADAPVTASGFPPGAILGLTQLSWQGRPNQLSPEHVDWHLEPVAEATTKPHTEAAFEPYRSPFPALAWESSPVHLRRIIRQRRSAVAMDAHTGITQAALYQMLWKTLAGPDQVPFLTLPWRPHVHLLLFVHRVQGLDPGLYFLVRDPTQLDTLRAALDPSFVWEKPADCPEGMELFRLVTGDARRVAAQVSCGQDIAADGCFSLAMLAEFEGPLRRSGPWFYPRLYWECGLIGQVLYLEAEASGIRATGIGCFFDDPVHELLGLQDRAYQDLYHFTVGGAVEDRRLSTLPAYPGE